MGRILFILLMTLAGSSTSAAEDRYPQYLPEWIWQTGGRYDFIMSDEKRLEVEIALKKAELLRATDGPGDMEKYWRKLEKAREILHSQYSDLDLSKDATIVTDAPSQSSLALQLDPNFTPQMAEVLAKAVALYLKVALRKDVIAKAFSESIDKPEPMPAKLLDGKVNDQYLLYSGSIARPVGVDRFAAEMRAALAPADGASRVLLISSYDLEPWWGGGLYGIFHDPDFYLQRTHPTGLLYIRLNIKKMESGQPSFDDPKFWASKIAHEVLHNLGYWHPGYKDPAERDRSNPPGRKAFIVAYEQAILAALNAEL